MSEAGRYALIVATDAYRDKRLRELRAPAADAQGLAAVLGDPSIGAFDVEVARNENDSDLRRRLGLFLKDRLPDDLLLLHFSCHGVKADGGRLYLAAADTEQDLLSYTAIDAEWLDQQIEECGSKRIVLFLDCCYSGAFRLGTRARGGSRVHIGDHFTGQGRGRIVITASSATEHSLEGDEPDSPDAPSYFTDAVIEALRTGKANRNEDGWVSVDELYEYVRVRVRERTPSQTPNRIGHVDGDLFIGRTTYRPPARSAVREPSRRPSEPPAGTEWRAGVRQVTAIDHGADIGALAFRPGTSQFATIGKDKHLRVWDLPDGRPIKTFEYTFLVVSLVDLTALAYSPDGRLLALGAKNGYTRIWDLPAGRKVTDVSHSDFGDTMPGVGPMYVTKLAFGRNGRYLATASANKSVRVWDLSRRRKRIDAFGSGDHPTGVAFGQDGNHLATSSWDRTVRVWELPGARVVPRWPRPSSSSNARAACITHEKKISAIALSPDGRRLASASGPARVWALPDGNLGELDRAEEITRIEFDGDVDDVAFSPNGGCLATAATDGTARIWRLPDAEQLVRIEHDQRVDQVAFSADGRYLATRARGPTALIWEAVG